MRAKERAPATYEELLKVPDGKIAEILDGDLEVSPGPGRATRRRVDDERGFRGAVSSPARTVPALPAAGGSCSSRSCTWAPTSSCPTSRAGGARGCPRSRTWLSSRWPPTGSARSAARGDERVVRVKKLPIYAREGVGHAWLADPVTKVLEVLRLEGAGGWSLERTPGTSGCAQRRSRGSSWTSAAGGCPDASPVGRAGDACGAP